MLRYIISFLLLSIVTPVLAQKIVLTEDSVKGKFLPTSVRIGTDVISITKTFLKDDFQQYVFSADVDFHRYYFNVEYGQFERTTISEVNLTDSYKVNGSYFRFGPDINFLKKDPEKNALFFGFRYARSTFSDQLVYASNQTFNNGDSFRLENEKLNAKWFEMVTGLKVRLSDIIWLGYTARFKFGVNKFEKMTLIPNEIPGYGRSEKNAYWGFNYWLIIKIPFRKADKALINLKGG